MSTKVLRRSRRLRAGSPSTWGAVAQQEVGNGLTRQRIVAAGVAVADQHGLAAVSIRKVASHLGSSAMALYHYIPSKRDLLNLMLDATYTELQFPAETITHWRAALSHFAWESRRCLKRHPWLSLLHADDPEYGPECIRTLESLLATLSQFGLDVRTAIRVLGALFVFVNGFVASETAREARSKRKGRTQTTGQPVFSKAVLASGKYPNVARFVETGAELPDDEGFERSLNWMLD